MILRTNEYNCDGIWPMADYLCTCLLDWEPGDFQKIRLCTGHSRSQPCYRCTSGTLPSSDCNFQLHWDRCCHCTGTGDKASQGRFYPEGLQSSRHHRAHIFYLRRRQSDVMKEKALDVSSATGYKQSGVNIRCKATWGSGHGTSLGEQRTWAAVLAW